jgi:predicted O-methyltransferase YrrM
LAKDLVRYCGKETIVDPSEVSQTVSIFLEEASSVDHILLRNTDPAGAAAQVTVSSIAVFGAKPYIAEKSPLLSHKRKRLLLVECEQILRGGELEESCNVGGEAIDVVATSEMHKAFGFERPFAPGIQIYRRSLAEFKTEIDEAAIFSYIYEQAKPARHLEFGTWEGFGAALCAKSCDAEIWTINLPHGEVGTGGNAVYGCNNFDDTYTDLQLALSAKGATDSGDFIGWRYRAAGFGHRVHQILCDSRNFDSSTFGAEFFDTILIDGGHTAPLVKSDTEIALPLLRSSGIMIWHDFCPDPQAVRLNEAPRGVLRAIIDNFVTWRPHFSRIFWIQPSWILVGIKAAASVAG